MKYAVYDNYTGALWGVAEAENPLQACDKLNTEDSRCFPDRVFSYWTQDNRGSKWCAVFAIPDELDICDVDLESVNGLSTTTFEAFVWWK